MLPRALPPGLALFLAATTAAPGQTITIRTVPITQSHQFDLFPSRSLAMGGVSIAVDDSIGDPFSNPAKGARIRTSRFFGAPGVYRVSNGAGAGRALPVGALARSGSWFGGGMVALQQVDLSEPTQLIIAQEFICSLCQSQGLTLPTGDRSPGNGYVFGMLGHADPESGFSIGGSVFWAGLHGIDGVDLLYSGSTRLVQRGHSLDLRLGAEQVWSGSRTLSGVLLHSRYATTHDVYFLDGFWDPAGPGFGQRLRLEENLDHTSTWGLHLQYTQPLRATGWKVGAIATTNVMSHPKIPNYVIQNIPRDPGNSEAFNVGVGISRSAAGATFGLDLVYEPIWSYTWADTPVPIATDAGGTIAAGGKTVENRFRFNNAIARMGFSQDVELTHGRGLGLQMGLSVHRIDYTLHQRNNLADSERRLDEDWVEWSPTWGLSLRFPAWELRYRGSVTNGTGRPGVFSSDRLDVAVPQSAGNVLVAPSGPLTLTKVQVMTHQISIAFPFR